MFNELVMHNFRCVDDATIKFDDADRSVLLCGRSGCGKSNAFIAINFALTGKGKKLVKYGAKFCYVRLRGKDVRGTPLEIYRSKGPCGLLLTYGDKTNGDKTYGDKTYKTYEDAEAQSVIDCDLFPKWQLGYIEQKLYKSFALMTPAEKLKYLECVAFGGDEERAGSVDRVDKSCADLVKFRKNYFSEVTYERRTLEKLSADVFGEKRGEVDENENENDASENDASEVAVEKLKEEKDLLERERAAAKTAYDKVKSLHEHRTRLENEVKKYEFQIVVTQEDVDRAYERKRRKEKLKSVETKLIRVEKELNGLSALGIDAIFFDEGEDCDEWKIVTKRLANVDEKSLRRRLDELLLSRAKFSLTCPSCNETLTYDSETAALARYIFDSSITTNTTPLTLADAIRDDVEAASIRRTLRDVEDLKLKRKTFEEKYVGFTNASELIDALRRHREAARLRDDLLAERDAEIKAAAVEEENVAFVETSVEELVGRKRKYDEISAKAKLVDDLPDERVVDEAKRKYDCANSAFSKSAAAETRAKRRKYEKSIAEIKAVEDDLSKRKIPSALKLRDFIIEAKKKALEELTDVINSNAQKYLKEFFDDSYVDVNVSFGGSRVDTNVTVDGFPSDVLSLSGGEIARVILAFAIAVAEANDVDCLMLDEILSPLDELTTERVIDVINTEFVSARRGRCVIYVSHQATTGLFDKIIDIEKSLR